MRTIQSWIYRLFQPQDIMPLVFFRVAFGGIMLWEVWRYFNFDRISRYFIEPTFYFHYYGFDWVKPLADDGMFWLFHYLGLLSICIGFGFLYRVAIIQFFFIFTYIFLLDETQYLNHFYLVCLVSFLLIWIPAHRKWSVDAFLFPKIRSETAPFWGLFLLRAQMAIVYVYGGIAKINADWLAGEPMRDWLSTRTDFPLIGQFFTEEWMVYIFSYGGLLFDLLIVPIILWKRTRWLGIAFMLGFHLSNARLFSIGIFPYFAIAATLIFLPPHWFRWRGKPAAADVKHISLTRSQVWIVAGIGIYLTFQILMPLRHWLYPYNPSWTEEGHNLAWHMKLRSKGGSTYFYAGKPDESSQLIPIENYLNARQISKMSDSPPMILRFARWLATQDAYKGYEIRVWSMMRLNSRAGQLFIDPSANLAIAPDDLFHDDWILPLMQPPAPHIGQPTLLISRRTDGVLILTNMTQHPFLLAGMTLSDGHSKLIASESGLTTLDSNACVVAYQPQVNPDTLFPICNEHPDYILLADTADFWQDDTPLTVNAPYQIECTRAYCIVTLPSTG